MGIEKNPLGKPCKGCFFLGKNLGNCDYWLIMDKLRPCPPGKDCTVKTTQTPKEFERVILWDTVLAQNLYKQGATDAEIAKACHASISEVKAFRRRHLGEANHKEKEIGGRRIGWDAEKGLELYRAGATDREIAEVVGVNQETIRNYRKKHWGLSNKKSSAAWDTEAARRMREEGQSFAAIARAVGTSANCVKQYARRHWRDKN